MYDDYVCFWKIKLHIIGDQGDLKENAVKTKYIFMSHQPNAGLHYNIKTVKKSIESSLSLNVFEQQ